MTSKMFSVRSLMVRKMDGDILAGHWLASFYPTPLELSIEFACIGHGIAIDVEGCCQ